MDKDDFDWQRIAAAGATHTALFEKRKENKPPTFADTTTLTSGEQAQYTVSDRTACGCETKTRERKKTTVATAAVNANGARRRMMTIMVVVKKASNARPLMRGVKRTSCTGDGYALS